MQQRYRSQSGSGSRVVEATVLQVGEERVSLVRQIRDDNVGPAIVVIVREIDAHSGKAGAVTIERGAGRKADFFELSISQVVEDELRDRIIGEKNIHQPV